MLTTDNRFKLSPGLYFATFLGVEEQHREYGPCLLWKYAITYGYRQFTVNRFTGPSPTIGSNCSEFLDNMLGRRGSAYDLLNINNLIGVIFTVDVCYYKGYPRVEHVS
jgi:hypothetical protein